MPAAPQIDLRTPAAWSQAHRDLAAGQGRLEELVKQHRHRAAETARGRSADELRELLRAVGAEAPAQGAQRRALRTTFVNASTRASDAAQELARLRRMADNEEMLAKEINRMMRAGRQADADLRRVTRTNAGAQMALTLMAQLDWRLLNQLVAAHAGRVAQAVADGADIEQAARAEYNQAMQSVGKLAHWLHTHGYGPLYRSSGLVASRAATYFCGAVSMTMQWERCFV
ncbi:hypothetical protein [Sphaerisporangium aureirubrum]|uniref:Uncharacterized protein n=1 Tax=Sphaerisporangium aureirubrum TaxID=1544736 RepID=A0ABW1NCA1_9ACTN